MVVDPAILGATLVTLIFTAFYLFLNRGQKDKDPSFFKEIKSFSPAGRFRVTLGFGLSLLVTLGGSVITALTENHLYLVLTPLLMVAVWGAIYLVAYLWSLRKVRT